MGNTVILREHSSYTSKKGKLRYIVQLERSNENGRTRVVYCTSNNLLSGVRSCYKEQFLRWLNEE